MSPEDLTPEIVEELRRVVDAGELPGFTFEDAMKCVLAGGVAPASGMPVRTLLLLDDWFRARRAGRRER